MTIKVMVVDDSAFMRKIVSDILKEDEEIEIIETARNGQDALEKLKKINPDVITLDIEMPIMDGITTLKEIINKYNIPVVMLSSLTVEGADATLKALEIGAVDFIPKPTNIFGLNKKEEKNKLIEKVKVASKIRKITKPSLKILEPTVVNRVLPSKRVSGEGSIIAIGTSTGGPRALQSVIPQLPADINASILVVQHMPEGFTRSLAARLNSMSNINVKEAENNDVLKKGYCYIAPGNYHMIVHEHNGDIIIKLNKSLPVSGHRPSVDVMMESVASISSMKKIAVIMTGMGSDGANGIKKISESGGYTIAQDEESCVVYGMPKAAVNSGTINKILPLNEISNELINVLGV
ncbi:MAG: chemotaxis response regulator protein-glutamate methylesterase [Gottschalkiaceae bacterium]|nr:MAG: chemotaxis response regulator protein-glutamate methylesterase [Gottschalkiaceae bacterium]